MLQFLKCRFVGVLPIISIFHYKSIRFVFQILWRIDFKTLDVKSVSTILYWNCVVALCLLPQYTRHVQKINALNLFKNIHLYLCKFSFNIVILHFDPLFYVSSKKSPGRFLTHFFTCLFATPFFGNRSHPTFKEVNINPKASSEHTIGVVQNVSSNDPRSCFGWNYLAAGLLPLSECSSFYLKSHFLILKIS